MILTKENASDELLNFRLRHIGMTQEKIFLGTEINISSLSDIENGKVKPIKKTLVRLNKFIAKYEGSK